MEQILAHLVGDYVLQSSYMALHKTRRWSVAWLHATFYTAPFLFITQTPAALAVILGTHAVIDRYRLARYISMARNMLGDPAQWRQYRTANGYPTMTPAWLATWLEIVIDNTLHLTINYFSIKYL